MLFDAGRLVAALLLCCLAGPAHAESGAVGWPQRALTILVPFAAGSTPDLVARVLADGLQPRLGKPVMVENRPGASGNIATNAVAKAAPDGHTLGVSIVGPLVINPLIMPAVPYDPARDLTPVSILAVMPSVLVAAPSLGVENAAGLVALLRAAPDRYNFGSIGKGSLSHLAMEALMAASGTRPAHVVFQGSPAAATALVRGDVQLAILPAGGVVPLGLEGKIRLLAVTSARRSPLLPDLPTLGEAGIPGIEADAWNGLIAPSGTPPAIVARILDETRAVLGEPGTAARLQPAYMTPVASTPEAFRALLAAEKARWEPVIRAGAIRSE